VSGFKVAGKTGTAQVFEKGKGYSHSRYRSSFCGYLPADAPEFTCLVFLDEPHMANQKAMGGLVCAPVFSRVAERAAGYLGLVPEPEPIPFQLAK
jgi:cell division protein FtsI/penicillin-binding protein 2